MPNCRNSDSMPNVRASSGMMGTTRLPSAGFLSSSVRTRTKAMVVDTSRPCEPASDSARYSSGGASTLLAGGHIAAQDAAALVQIRHLGTIVRGTVERSVARRFIRDGDLEARAEMRNLRLVQFFLLMGDVAPLARFAQAVSLDSLRQDQGRRSGILH